MRREEALDIVGWVTREFWSSAARNGKVTDKPKVFAFFNELSFAAGGMQLPATIKGPLTIPHERIRVRLWSLNPPQWAFFSDDHPDANWEHPCRYILIHKDREGGIPVITAIEDTAPPSVSSNNPITEVKKIFFE